MRSLKGDETLETLGFSTGATPPRGYLAMSGYILDSHRWVCPIVI